MNKFKTINLWLWSTNITLRQGHGAPASMGLCNLPKGHRTAPRSQLFILPDCLFLPSQRVALLSLSVVSRWFASTHCHPSVRPWPIKLALAPISLLQLCWLFLDSIPPLISSSEISLHGSRGLVVGCWGLEGQSGVRREETEWCMRRIGSYWISWFQWQYTLILVLIDIWSPKQRLD